MVMLYHFISFASSLTDNRFLRSSLPFTVSMGWTGVDAFFVLSGFLITSILLKTRSNPHYFRNFYARRILRIFPLYYLAVAVVYISLPFLSANPDPAAQAGWPFSIF